MMLTPKFGVNSCCRRNADMTISVFHLVGDRHRSHVRTMKACPHNKMGS